MPIPKSGHKNDPSNYRPISLLSIVSKLLEKIVYSRLWEDLVHGSSISECQWGFQKHKSTTTALLSTTHEWFQLMDRKLDVMCVFLITRKLLIVFLIEGATITHWCSATYSLLAMQLSQQ